MRFTVRQMMIAVAIVAVCISVRLTYERYAQYRKMFIAYGHDLHFIKGTIRLNEQRLEVLRSRKVLGPKEAAEAASITEFLPYMSREVQEAERRKLRYEWAMWHPWSHLDAAPSDPLGGRQ